MTACVPPPRQPPSRIDARGMRHAQVKQDITVLTLLDCQRGGYFVDLAANDAIELSNTRALERDFGWYGLCVEPNTKYHTRLRALRTCAVAPYAVAGAGTSSVRFAVPYAKRIWDADGGAFGGMVEFPQRERRNVSILTLPARPLGQLLEDHGAPAVLDYVSLDIEGAESLALSTFPWGRHRIRVLTIERPPPELQRTLQQRGRLRFLARLGYNGEQVWVHESLRPPATCGGTGTGTQHEHAQRNKSAPSCSLFCQCSPSADRGSG